MCVCLFLCVVAVICFFEIFERDFIFRYFSKVSNF